MTEWVAIIGRIYRDRQRWNKRTKALEEHFRIEPIGGIHDKSVPKGSDEALEGKTPEVPHGVDAPMEVQSRKQNRRDAESKAAKVRNSR